MKTLHDARKRLVYTGWHSKPPQAEKEGVYIMNAPRPLIGKETWQGDFISGIFYALIDTNDQFKIQQFGYQKSDDPVYEWQIHVNQNVELDAALLIWFGDEELEQYKQELAQEYNLDLDEINDWYDQDDLVSSYIESKKEL